MAKTTSENNLAISSKTEDMQTLIPSNPAPRSTLYKIYCRFVHEQKGTRSFPEALFLIVNNQNYFNSCNGWEQISKLLCIHTVEYSTALNMNKPIFYHSWMRRDFQDTRHNISPFMWVLKSTKLDCVSFAGTSTCINSIKIYMEVIQPSFG